MEPLTVVERIALASAITESIASLTKMQDNPSEKVRIWVAGQIEALTSARAKLGL